VRKTHFILLLSLFCLLSTVAGAATFKLNDGRAVTGEIIESGSNDATALLNVEGKYEKVPWGQFSQEDLKAFLERYARNKKIVDAIEPFIETTQEERAQITDVPIKPVQRLDQPPRGSVIGSLFQSGLGLFLVLVVWAANVYAGYEISTCRAQPIALVAGLAAIPFLGIVSNIVFLALPTRVATRSEEDLAYETDEATAAVIALPGQEMQPGNSHAATANGAEAAAAAPRAEVFTRGQFTFNKRFFETKFPGYFGIVRREEDRLKRLIFKTSKGEFVAQRISRITPSDIHLQVERGGGASVEMAFQYPEILEVTLKHQS
jgi:hypothetical protein